MNERRMRGKRKYIKSMHRKGKRNKRKRKHQNGGMKEEEKGREKTENIKEQGKLEGKKGK